MQFSLALLYRDGYFVENKLSKGIVSSFELGTVRKYSYETTVTVNDECRVQDHTSSVGHRVTGYVELSTLWRSKQNEMLIKIEVTNPRLSVPKKNTFTEHRSRLDNLKSGASYLLWKDGSSKRFWDDPSQDTSLRNLKKSIGSLLHFQTNDQQVKEEDVSGQCDVIYTSRGRAVRKRKANCVHPGFDKTLAQALGVRSVSVYHQSIIDYELEDEETRTISQCSVSEFIKVLSNTWHRLSLCIDTKTKLNFKSKEKISQTYDGDQVEDIINYIRKNHDGNLEETKLESDLTEKQHSKKDIKPLIENLQERLKSSNIASVKSAIAFYKILPVLRVTSKTEILEVLQEKSFSKINSVLLNIVSACATEDCIEAAFEYFGKVKGYNENFEKFIISMAVLPRPTSYHLQKLKTCIEKKTHDERIRASLLTTFGTLLKTYAENYEIVEFQLAEDMRMFLEKGLEQCNKETCILSYLRGLRNAARPQSLPIFLQFTKKGGKIGMESVLGLRQTPERFLPLESQKTLLNVFNQAGSIQDRSTRIIAAELLLRLNPDESTLRSLLRPLSDQTDPEFSTHLAAKIMNRMENDVRTRSVILKLLPEKDISYYYALAQKGQSFLFNKPMISVEGMNVTYGLDMEMLSGGLLKRSFFDVTVRSDVGDTKLFSVVLFGEGLGSIAGGDSEENSDPTAGMELGILNSSLRPYIFFKSTSELMGHVWSGTGSELTPIIQYMSCFSDDERLLVLTNGMVVRIHLRGILGSDSSAFIKISLWNRNSNSMIQNKGALLLRGSVSVDSGFAVSQGAFQFSGESKIDFKTNLDFYESPFTSCLQMEHPDVVAKFDVHRSVDIPGTKYHIRRSKKRIFRLPGRSFALHEKNNAMCRTLMAEQ